MNYQQSIEFIQSFPDAERGLPGIKSARNLKMPLSTMKALLQKMGNPQNAAHTIHITGSKGKGSTATFIAAILKQAGLRTALFTSPHIHSYLERIAFDGGPVGADLFAQGIADLKPLIESFDQNGETVSTFGILTALFFKLVKETSPVFPWQIVEVGLGGKDDLTNVFARKDVVVITPISLEHTAILGSTRIAIAENKAGIITPGCLVVLAPQPDEDVVKIIRRICKEKEAELIEVSESNGSINGSIGGSITSTPTGEASSYQIGLRGEHQITNAMTALAVIEALNKRKKISVSQESIKAGLETAFIPGRFEVIESCRGRCNRPADTANTGALHPPLQLQYTVVLDGAHNGDSAEALAKTLYQVFPDKPVILILGVNEDKDLEAIWLALKDNISALVATRSDNYRALPPQEICNRIKKCDPSIANESNKIIVTDNIDQALKIADEIANSLLGSGSSREREEGTGRLHRPLHGGGMAVICVCGSLYLVAEARERLVGFDTRSLS